MNRKSFIAGTMAVVLVLQSTGVNGADAFAAEKSGSGKEEVIYIMTDATGKVQSVNAVNIFGKGSVTDYGKYSQVKMLNTTDEIKNEDGRVTFSSDKAKVYYQGTMEDTEIPWNIKFVYKLDGEEMSAKEIAGKSGKLEIHLKIEKNKNCKTDFYDSSALQVSMTLDTEKCENITADGATIANVGADKQVSYTILPGKGLDAVIKTDVTDFEMDAAQINGVKLDLDIDVDDDELMDKVDEIMSAAKRINKGANKLSDGSSRLVDGGSNLTDGTESLDSGINSLDNGVDKLDGGIEDMQNALQKLNSKSGKLTKGSKQMKKGLKQIQKQLSKVSMTTKQLKQLKTSSASIKTGLTQAYDGAVQLSGSLSYDSYKAVMQTNGLDIDKLESGNEEAVNTLKMQIESLNTSIDGLRQIPGYEANEEYKTQVEQLSAQVNSLTQLVTLLQGNNANISGTKQYFETVSEKSKELSAGIEQLKTSYEKFDIAIVQLADKLSELSVNMTKLKKGINQMVKSYNSLDKGIDSYTSGVNSIEKAFVKLSDATGTLEDGTKELVSGSKDLNDGAKTLYNGIVKLDDGAIDLSDGTKEFYEKTDDMDTQVEDAIDDMIDDISGGDSKTESFVSDKNKNVKSVQFVIKTTAIEKKEVAKQEKKEIAKKSFWDKLLGLFGM